MALEGGYARLETRAFWCDDSRLAATAGTPRVGADPNRVETERSRGELNATEWWVAGPLGLEHGFDVAAHACDELVIEVVALGVDATSADEGVRLGGLRYADVFANDAEGSALPARLDVSGATIELHVTTRGTVWPVVVDPLLYVEGAIVGPVPDAPGDGGSGATGCAGHVLSGIVGGWRSSFETQTWTICDAPPQQARFIRR